MQNTTVATRRPVAETLRAMSVGEIQYFPVSQYNTLRSSRHGTLIDDVLNGGAEWKIRLNRDEKRVEVTRIS